MRKPIPLAKPSISNLEREYVDEVLASGQLAMGPWIARFEAAMAARCGTRFAVGVSSGTAALHLIVRALGLGDGDEVITTPFSFVASSNCLLFERCTPRFVDIDPATYNIDVERAEAALSDATRGILAVDVFGEPAGWPALTALSARHDLRLIDDGCEALGSAVAGRPIGSWGDACAFGFYPNKQITTGEGGMITTNDERIASFCRSLRNQGRGSDDRMEHVSLGYNYRLSEIAAALGCAQLERFDELQERRGRVAEWYREALSDLQDDVALPYPSAATGKSWFVYVIRLKDHFGETARDVLQQKLAEAGIQSAPYFPAIHLQPYYRREFGFKPGDFPIAENVAERTLALPFFPDQTHAQVRRVAGALREAIPHLSRKETVSWSAT